MTIEPVPFRNPRHPALAFEAMTLAELRARVPARHLLVSSRPQFHQLILVSRGGMSHFIDFVEHACHAGSVLHVRPGQVQRLVLQPRAEGVVLLFAPEFLPRPKGMDGLLANGMTLFEAAAPSGVVMLPQAEREAVAAAFQLTLREYQRTDGAALSAAVMRHQLLALLLLLARASLAGQPGVQPVSAAARVYLRFVREVEARHARERSVARYAANLGCSGKTLTRACQAVAGASPKEVIERRVALEAKRLLAHSTASVVAIASDLGFSEATNFVKFFRRREGMAPLAFRAANRAVA